MLLLVTCYLLLVTNFPYHLLGFHPLIELFGSNVTQVDGGLLKGFALLVCGLGDFSGFVVSDLGIECGHEHQRVIEILLDIVMQRLDADCTLIVE